MVDGHCNSNVRRIQQFIVNSTARFCSYDNLSIYSDNNCLFIAGPSFSYIYIYILKFVIV